MRVFFGTQQEVLLLTAAGTGGLETQQEVPVHGELERRIEPADPHEPLDDLFGQAGPLHHLGQAPVRPAGELRIEPFLVLLADPLDETETESHSVVRRGPGCPSSTRSRRRDDTGR